MCMAGYINGSAEVVDIFGIFRLVGPIAIIRKPKWTVRWRWNYWHYSLQINTFIRSVSTILQETSGVSSPHQNKENRFMWIYVRKHLAFEVEPNSVLTSVLQIFMCGVTKKPLVYSVPIENEETLHKHVFDACQTIGNRPANIQGEEGAVHGQTCPWFRWRKFWASVVNCDLINNKSITVIKRGMSIVNVL